jgi:hypothetical protein
VLCYFEVVNGFATLRRWGEIYVKRNLARDIAQEQDDEIDLSAALEMNVPPAKKVCQ